MNSHLQTIVVALMAGQSKRYPTRIENMHNNKGRIVLDQIWTIDMQRII